MICNRHCEQSEAISWNVIANRVKQSHEIHPHYQIMIIFELSLRNRKNLISHVS